jgi:S-adenosylmethionine hydrolase
MDSSPLLTLTTDFGLKDGTAGILKGVIWSICPQARIADISHLIRPQDILEAAFVLARAVPYFPAGTIHLVVVDPGVGTARRPMAARLGQWYYVGPDNGALTLLLERAEDEGWPLDFVHLNRPAYWLAEVSHVFHGRDIFAPCAAHLARGVPLHELGEPFGEAVRLPLPRLERTARGWQGQVIYTDHFGNLVVNMPARELTLGRPEDWRVLVKGRLIRGLARTFGEHPPGELIALPGSSGYLILAQVNGSAAELLGATTGETVEVWLEA